MLFYQVERMKQYFLFTVSHRKIYLTFILGTSICLDGHNSYINNFPEKYKTWKETGRTHPRLFLFAHILFLDMSCTLAV